MSDKKYAHLIGLGIGVLISIPALFFAIASTGGGHGTYLMARLFFPLTMLSTWPLGSITTPFIVAAILQFPVYGFVIGQGFRSGQANKPTIIVFGSHVLLVALNFIVLNPFFK